MAIGILADTNIFLEILLEQNKKEDCKYFLQSTNEPLFISDFSLHSIGVILLSPLHRRYASGAKSIVISNECEKSMFSNKVAPFKYLKQRSLPTGRDDRLGFLGFCAKGIPYGAKDSCLEMTNRMYTPLFAKIYFEM